MSATDSKHTTIRVSNIPDETTEVQLKIHFQRKKNGGGEVTEVQMFPDTHEALVVFEEKEVAESAITKEHVFRGIVVHVEKYEETEDECGVQDDVSKEERTVLVSELPEGITENVLTIYFQRKRNAGGEVKEVKLFSDRNEALVVFEDYKVTNAVVRKTGHVIHGKVVQVECYKDIIKDVEEIHKKIRTVQVSDLPEDVTENILHIYFQKRKNGGGEIENVTLLPDGHALVAFDDPKVARGVLSKEHTIQGRAVRVKPQETESQTPNEKREVLVSGLPDGITENEVHIYFQKKRNKGGEIRKVSLLSRGTALVAFEDPKVASAVVDREQILKGKLLKLKIAEGESPIMVSNLSEESEVAGDDQMESGHKMQTKRDSDDGEKKPEKEPRKDSGREHKDNRYPGSWEDKSTIQEDKSTVSAKPKVTKEDVKIQQMTKGNVNEDIYESPTATNKENAKDLLSMHKEKDYLGKTMLVSDIPDGVRETEVLLYFQKRIHGGGEVEKVKLFPDRRQALVIFAEVQVAENVVLKEHMLAGEHVRVEKYNPKPKETKVECVFTTVTATIKFYLLQTIEPTLVKTILDETQAVTGIQWHQAAYGLLITGSLEQVKKANDVLKEKLSGASSQQQNTAEHVQGWQGIAKGPDAKPSEYQGDRSMMGPASENDTERHLSQISVRNESHFSKRNSSHRNMEPNEPSRNFVASSHGNMEPNEPSRNFVASSHGNMEPNEPSRNFVAEVSNQKQHWIRDEGWKADWDDNQRSSDSNVFGKKSEDSGKAKKSLETAGRHSSSSPLHSPRASTAGNRSRNEAGTPGGQELKTPADFQQPSFANSITQQGSVASSSGHPEQQPSPVARVRAQHQNSANADTPPAEEPQVGKAKPARPQSHADRRPNAANFSPTKQPRSVEDNLFGPKAAAGTTNLLGGTWFENPQGSFEKQSVAAVDDKVSSHGSLQHETDGAHQLNSADDSKNSDLPTDAHDSKEPSVDYEKIQDASLDIIENAFQQMKLDEEPSVNVAQFIQQVYQEDLEIFKSQYNVDVVFSQDKKRFTLKPVRGTNQSKLNEAERKLQQLYESTSGKLKAFTIDLRKFTTEDTEKIKKSMSSQRGQYDVMIEESNRDVYTLIGDAENVDMFRRNVIGALQKNSPVSKETAVSTEPLVAARKGVRVVLMLGEIEKQECGAIVNFTDTNLVHKAGLASAIRQAAGATFWSECRDIIAKNGALLNNMVTITTAGSLPCKYVIHVIVQELPKEGRHEILRHNLQETCRLALNKAKENQMKSICFPVVTSDYTNLPIAVSSRLLFEVILEFIEENSPLNNNTIEEIRIIYRKSSKYAEESQKNFRKIFNV